MGISTNILSPTCKIALFGSSYIRISPYTWKNKIPGGENATAVFAPNKYDSKIGNAIRHDGIGVYESFPANTINNIINGNSQTTIKLGIKLKSLNNSGQKYYNTLLVGYINDVSSGIWINVRNDGANTGNLLIGGRSSATNTFQEVTTAKVFSLDVFYDLKIVYDWANNRIRLYIDGVLYNSYTVSWNTSIYQKGTATSIDCLGLNYGGNYGYCDMELNYFLLDSENTTDKQASIQYNQKRR